MSLVSDMRSYGDESAGSSILPMESSTSRRPGAQKTMKSFGKVTGGGGKENGKWCATSCGDIPVGSLTPSGGGQPRLDLFSGLSEKTGSVPGSLGPTMTTEFCSPWQGTRRQSSSPKSYIGPKPPSAIASLSWARAVAFSW